MPLVKTWSGSKTCDACLRTIKDKLYDARVTRDGHWATLCQHCYQRSGAGLGEGRGQEYTEKNGRFIKTAG